MATKASRRAPLQLQRSSHGALWRETIRRRCAPATGHSYGRAGTSSHPGRRGHDSPRMRVSIITHFTWLCPHRGQALQAGFTGHSTRPMPPARQQATDPEPVVDRVSNGAWMIVAVVASPLPPCSPAVNQTPAVVHAAPPPIPPVQMPVSVGMKGNQGTIPDGAFSAFS
jgi:hypothetical protein